jgi:hypothetical protein
MAKARDSLLAVMSTSSHVIQQLEKELETIADDAARTNWYTTRSAGGS